MIDTEHGVVAVDRGQPILFRRDTNTIVIPLEQDEVLTLIADLARAAHSGQAFLTIEQDEITHPREVK